MAGKVTISEALGWMKTLRERHAELLSLRNQNASRELRYHPTNSDKDTVKEPVYDIKALDAQVSILAREIRKLDMAIKHANATLHLPDYEMNEEVLGQVTTPAK